MVQVGGSGGDPRLGALGSHGQESDFCGEHWGNHAPTRTLQLVRVYRGTWRGLRIIWIFLGCW